MAYPASFLLALMLLQYPYPMPYPNRTVGPRLPAAPPGGAITDVAATFSGAFKSADKKFLTLEVENGQTLRMYITSSTKFFRDDKQVKASDFKSGDKVDVDATRDSRQNLVAVRVAPAKPVKREKAPEAAPDSPPVNP
jgi:hypothetical protein